MKQLLFLLILFSSQCAQGQTPFSKDLALNESSRPVKVNAQAQDKTGYLWIGTDEGLYCFNGRTFTKIEDTVKKPVTALIVSGNDLWIGYANGKIAKLINSKIELLPLKSTSPKSKISALNADTKGILIACTEDEGAFIIVNDSCTVLNTGNGLSDNFIYTVLSLEGGRILLGTDNGINDIEFRSGKSLVSLVNTSHGLPDNIVRVMKHIPQTPLVLLGTQEGGIALYDLDKKGVQYPDACKNWKWGQVDDILIVSREKSWIVTETGFLLQMLLSKNGQLTFIPYFYPGKKFKKLLLDNASNIWIGTNEGLTMVTAEYMSCIKLGAPYELQKVSAICCDKNHKIWFAQDNMLYAVSKGENYERMSKTFSAKADIKSLFVDAYGTLWIGTLGDGLWFKSVSSLKFQKFNLLKNESILNISGNAKSLWVAGLNGVKEIAYSSTADKKPGVLKYHDKNSGVGSDYVYQLFADSKNNVWMATDGAGICRYDGANYTHWNDMFKANGNVAYSITEDNAGGIWVGAPYKDLYLFSNNKWVNTRSGENQSMDINLSAIKAAANGRIVSVYQRCIDVWYPGCNSFRHFNRRLGLGIDSTSNALNCIASDSEGNVYVPFEHGIIVFKGQNEKFDIRPKVDITNTSIYLENKPLQLHRFDYGDNYVSFHFNGINFSNPERLNYRYKLSGYSENWIPTNDESVTFPKLPPGKYNFIVQASVSSSFDNALSDEYTFIIASPFWLRPWFIIAGLVIIAAAAYQYIKLREKRLKNVSQLQQERMKFEYEHLRSQVNPHFLFNSLNTLASLIDENKENAVDYTVNLSDLYRNMLAYHNKDLILLSGELNILKSYIFIQQSRFGKALNIAFDIPEQLLQNKKIVPMALQLLVENAIKHNIVSNKQPLLISIFANENEITVKNTVQKKMSREKGAGMGLLNIHKRYRLLARKGIMYGEKDKEFFVTLPLL